MTKNPDTHPLAPLVQELRGPWERYHKVEQAERSRRRRASELHEELEKLRPQVRDRSAAFLEGEAKREDVEALVDRIRHLEGLLEGKAFAAERSRIRREQARKPLDEALTKLAPAVERRVRALAAEAAGTFARQVDELLEPLAELSGELATEARQAAGVGAVLAALRAAPQAAGRRDRAGTYRRDDHGDLEPIGDGGPRPEDVLRRAAGQRTDATAAGPPVGVEAGRVMQ